MLAMCSHKNTPGFFKGTPPQLQCCKPGNLDSTPSEIFQGYADDGDHPSNHPRGPKIKHQTAVIFFKA
jgi:hypothetical protein